MPTVILAVAGGNMITAAAVPMPVFRAFQMGVPV